MTKEKIFMEFQQRAGAKKASLNIEDAPYSREEAEAHLEGWRSAWSWAVDVLADIVTEKED